MQATEIDALVEGTDEGAAVTVTKKKRTAKAVSTVPVFGAPCICCVWSERCQAR